MYGSAVTFYEQVNSAHESLPLMRKDLGVRDKDDKVGISIVQLWFYHQIYSVGSTLHVQVYLHAIKMAILFCIQSFLVQFVPYFFITWHHVAY